MTDEELRDCEIIPSEKRIPLTPETRKKIIERLLPDPKYGYAKMEPYLTAEERVQYGPQRN